MRPLTALPLLLAALACGSAPRGPGSAVQPSPPSTSSSAAPDTARGVSIGIPPGVAQFRFASRRDYEDPALGVQLRYRGPHELIADVYVYPGPDFGRGCDSACAAAAFERELAQFQGDFPEMVQRRYFDSIAVAASAPLPPGPDRPWRLGRQLQLDVVREGKSARSDFSLFYLPGYRVKVRVTYEPTPERTQAIDAFMRALLPQLVGAPAPAPPG